MANNTQPPQFLLCHFGHPLVAGDVPVDDACFDKGRAYCAGETVHLQMASPTRADHPQWLRAQVLVGGTEGITVRAMHSVLGSYGESLVAGSDVIDVDRACVFVVGR